MGAKESQVSALILASCSTKNLFTPGIDESQRRITSTIAETFTLACPKSVFTSCAACSPAALNFCCSAGGSEAKMSCRPSASTSSTCCSCWSGPLIGNGRSAVGVGAALGSSLGCAETSGCCSKRDPCCSKASRTFSGFTSGGRSGDRSTTAKISTGSCSGFGTDGCTGMS